ncbi:MAG: glycosyltransferase [Chloroflexota bacterium]|nr:MAG: glycosyltransferase [Chloroflexota bacterium]
MSVVVAVALTFSVLVLIQAAYTVYLMIYTWDQPDAYKKSRAPEVFFVPRRAFTVLLPARHEEEVIQGTIERVVRANYPKELMEILVICESGDLGTIAKANEKIDGLRKEGISNARVVIFNDRPINKPHGLNVGLRQSSNEVVTIFDAEDEVHPEIFNVVNTVMEQTSVRVVQCGVQLMNYASSWYSTLNVLEYFFWFKSRLHYHAQLGMIPLGGNTVFFARELLEQIGGWDETNLTEDADIGIRISVTGEDVRVVYDDRYVTKEETPPTLAHFIRQRTRWSQGFLQTLRKGTWTKLPGWEQRLLALYTLAFPSFQAVLTGYVLLSLWMMLAVRVTTPVAMLLISPAYLLFAHYIISVVGLYEFADAHGLHPSKMAAFTMALSYIPYQWVLGYASVRAAIREMRGINNWEKTAHVGAHRQASGGEQPEAVAHGHSEAA